MIAFKKISLISKYLSNGLQNEWGIKFKLALLYFGSRFFGIEKDTYLQLFYHDKKFNISVSNLDDLNTLYEIFIEQTYKVDELKNPSVIVDLGANIGIVTLYLSLKYPEAKVFSIEPTPKTFSLLKENTQQLANVTVIQCAVSDTNGEVDFYISESRSHSSSILSRGEGFKEVKVITSTLKRLIEDLQISKIDLLKFDIEGAEYKIANDIRPEIVKSLVGEMHYDLNFENAPKDLGLSSFYNLTISGGEKRAIIKGVPIN